MNTEDIKKDLSREIAAEFIAYANNDAIVDFIFPLASDKIKEKLNVFNKENLLVAITYDDTYPETTSLVENNIFVLTDIISETLETLHDKDFKNFACLYYNKDFSF